MYFAVAKLRLLMTHDASAVPIFCRFSYPLPVVAAAFCEKSAALVSSRFERKNPVRGFRAGFLVCLVAGTGFEPVTFRL